MTTDRFGWLRILAYLCLLFLGMLSVSAQAQNHAYCPTDGVCTWTNPQTGPFIDKGGQVYSAQAYSGADVCAQIAAAITAMPAQGGVVDARNFIGDQTCSSGTITLGSTSKPVTLLLGNGRIISNANPVISVPGSSWIVGLNSSGSFSAVDSVTAGATVILWTGSNGGIRNVFINVSPGAGAGIGLYLQASGTTSVQYNQFENIQINGPGGSVATSVGVKLEAATTTSLVSHNIFTNVWAHDFATDFALATSSTVGPTDNTFINLNPQSFGGAAGVGIGISSGGLNNFFGGIAEGLTTGIDLEGGSYNSFFGFRTESNTNNIVDNGTGTMFVGHSIDVATITGTDANRTYIGQGNANTLQKFPTGIQANGTLRGLSTAGASSLPLFGASDDTNTGYHIVALDHTLRGFSSGNGVFLGVPTKFVIGSGSVFGLSSGADPTLTTPDTGLSRDSAGVIDAGNGTAGDSSGKYKAAGYLTSTNCASAGGTCSSASAGRVSIAAAATTVTVATTAVTANSEIFIQEDATLGTALSVTCNTTTGRTYTVTTRTAGTSFVITASAAPTTNPACLSYRILN